METTDDAASAFVAVTPDGGVRKRIVRAGLGRVPAAGDVVTLHYVGWIVDTSGAGGAKRQFDSSRERGQEFSFTLGKEETLLGLENAVATMRVDELALVVMRPRYAYAAAGSEHGFHSFGRAIPPDATLEMELELLHASSQDEFAELDRVRERPLDERMVAAAALKADGNAAYAQQQYRAACTLYKQAIALLRLVQPTPEESRLRGTLLVPLSLNVAQCLMQEKLYKEAEAYLETALYDAPTNAKALYRTAVCFQQQGKVEEALDYAQRARGQHDTREVRELLADLKQVNKQVNNKAAATYKQIFNNKSAPPVYTQKHVQRQKLDAAEEREQRDKYSNCSVCNARMLRKALPAHLMKAHGDAVQRHQEEAPPPVLKGACASERGAVDARALTQPDTAPPQKCAIGTGRAGRRCAAR